MRNPITRLFYIGILGLGFSTAMIAENYLSKSNSTWEYVIAIVLAIFSIAFITTSIILRRKRK